MGLILQDCMYLLNNLNGCAITFANRSANQAAHDLAKVVISLSNLGEWSCTPPPLLSKVIHMDLFRINTISICQKKKSDKMFIVKIDKRGKQGIRRGTTLEYG